MSDVWNFLKNDEKDPYKRGIKFEKIYTKKYLKKHHLFSKLYKDVLLWEEWEERPFKTDIGIDLICIGYDDKITAVQAKAYNPLSSISKPDIDSFITASNSELFSSRLLIGTTDKIGKNAKAIIANEKRIPFQTHLLTDLENSEFLEIIKTNNKLQKNNIKLIPRPHQNEAITKTLSYFKSNDSGQIIMACGTGKTLTSFWITEKIKAKKVLFLAPSISLLSQTLDSWLIVTKNLNPSFFVICSDQTAGSVGEEYPSDYGFPSSTNSEEIKEFITTKENFTIFSTYQSSHIAMKEAIKAGINFDIVVCDEAHRLAGKIENNFNCVINNKFPAKKKLYMTATPKIFPEYVVKKGIESDIEIISMDNEKIFGKTIYELSFGEAIEKKLLADYKIIVTGMKKDDIDENTLLNVGEQLIDLETYAKALSLKKILKKKKLSKTITFHTFSKAGERNAKIFSNLLQTIGLNASYISGADSARDRLRKINKLRKSKKPVILSNARVLSEGIDVPEIDSIAFIDPKSSISDIVQAVGRAIRSKKNKDQIGHIILPIVLNDTKNQFDLVYKTAIAMRAHDARMGEQIDNFRISMAEKSKYKIQNLPNLVIDLPKTVNSDIHIELVEKIITASSQSWFFWYGLLKKYVKETGIINVHQKTAFEGFLLGSWVQAQRKFKNKNQLSKEKIKLLDEIGFIYDPLDELWNSNYELLLKHYKKNGNTDIPSRQPGLGKWISHQRSYFKNNKLSKERIDLLNEIGFEFAPVSNKVDEFIDLINRYYDKFGEFPNSKDNAIFEGVNVRDRLYEQRKKYKNGSINPDIEQRLKELNFNFDYVSDKLWDLYIEDLSFYAKKHNHTYPKTSERGEIHGKNLASFVLNVRKGYSGKEVSDLYKLNKAKASDLENIKNWNYAVLKVSQLSSLSPGEKIEQAIDEIENFIEVHKRQPKTIEIDFKNSSFRSPVKFIRDKYNNNELSKNEINRLTKVGFIFNPKDINWNKYIEDLVDFCKKNKHSNPPRNTKGRLHSKDIHIFAKETKKSLNNPNSKSHKFHLTEKRIEDLINIPYWNSEGLPRGRPSKKS